MKTGRWPEKKVLERMFEIIGLKYKGILDIPALTLSRPVVCILGASGSGKTTLLRMLNKLNAPDEGKILYRGEELAGLESVALRRRVVMLGQTPVLYDGDIAENLLIGRTFSQKPPVGEEALLRSLERVGLHKGLHEACHNLSGGEKQRLCLARVMLMDAETYLLDEPSAALDKETEGFVVDAFARFAEEGGRQLIMVTHSEQVAARYPDSRVTLEKGRVKEARV